MTLRAVVFCVATALAGACTAPVYDTAPPFHGDPPAVYVAKIKNILIGMPATDADIAAVTKDPTALGTLIDTWMTQPPYAALYQQKLQVFFELQFQQTQVTQADFVDLVPGGDGLGFGKAIPLLVQNARESFARTAVALVTSGQPLTAAFTTKQLMMTPALMALYALMDDLRTDDNGKVSDSFSAAAANKGLTFTMEAAAGPIPIAQTIDPTSPNYMHFYNPAILTQHYANAACDNLDPITINKSSFAIWEMLYGQIPDHKTPAGVDCAVSAGIATAALFSAADFTTWKLVTIAPATAANPPTRFFDLPTLKAADTLYLGTPHPGFFSTPAFFANWPTNTSNQMRVTVNQALIVATGSAIDGTDPTIPPSTPGLDATHSVPGSACVGCHQLLDPTRSILSATYSWFYSPQSDATLTAQPGLFAFQGVIKPMATIDDFATLLATHPLVAQGWAQKLCYYVNSAPCDPGDQAFQKIVSDFAAGYQWNTLVHELLASPITTNAAPSQTNDTNGEVVAVARRDHLCAMLNNRLGFVDICQLDESDQVGKPLTTIAQIVSGMPSDGYGRGSTIPVLPNQPTLFYRGGLENICAAVSTEVIDATLDPDQPGAKAWSSAQPDAAIADFVSIVMGLTSADPRAAQAASLLSAHFTAAMQPPTSSTPTDALRSTFVAACLAPSFIGIGM